jgi:glycosyltransferase involved in cell wall biosynthesis
MLANFAQSAPTVGVRLTVGYLKAARDGAALERLRALGIEPELVPVRRLLGRRDLARVRQHLGRVGGDLVHTHLKYADVLGGIAARSLRLPVVSTLHEASWTGAPAERVKQRLAGLVRRHCAGRVIAVSEAARRSYLATGWDEPGRLTTVRNSIVEPPRGSSRAQMRTRFGLGSADLVVAMVSALRPEKGHEHAFAAFEALRHEFPELRLLVIGDGPRREEVERMAAPLGPAVVVAGYQDDVAGILTGADVLLHPSHVDAFPTALLEAMAASIPVVATSVGGIPEIVVHGDTGLLVAPPPDPGRIAAALGRLLEDARLREAMGTRARQRFEREFSAETWLRQTRDVYDTIIAAGPSPRLRSRRWPGGARTHA